MRKIIYIVLAGGLIVSLGFFAITGIKRISKSALRSGGFRCGDFIVAIKLPNLGDAGITVTPSNRPYPIVIFQQTSYTNKKDKVIGYVTIGDSKNHLVEVEYDEGGREFKSLKYSITSNRVSYIDRDMDGEFDTRLGPEKRKSLFINGKWHDIQVNKSGVFVKDGDHLRRAIVKNGKWAIDLENGQGQPLEDADINLQELVGFNNSSGEK